MNFNKQQKLHYIKNNSYTTIIPYIYMPQLANPQYVNSWPSLQDAFLTNDERAGIKILTTQTGLLKIEIENENYTTEFRTARRIIVQPRTEINIYTCIQTYNTNTCTHCDWRFFFIGHKIFFIQPFYDYETVFVSKTSSR